MKILFGVQGTGNGHLSRCRTIAYELRALDVEVDYVFSGRDRSKYFDMDVFGDFQCFDGLTFATSHGHMNLFKTLMSMKPFTLIKDIKALDVSAYDLVVSDFEPITAWAARIAKVPCLGISHQASFQYPIPRQGEGFAGSLLMKYYAPTQRSLGLHWYHYGFPILPPAIDPLPEQLSQGHILVYLPFEDPKDMISVLSRFTLNTFICFHPSVTEAYQVGEHLHFEPYSRENFKQKLCTCDGVITNGGFELASEALSIGKRLLIKPLTGQFEQETNAMTLESLGLGKVMLTLDAGDVRAWLSSVAPGKVTFPNVAAQIAHWLADGAREPAHLLSEKLWSQVIFPEIVLERIAEMNLEHQPQSQAMTEFSE